MRNKHNNSYSIKFTYISSIYDLFELIFKGESQKPRTPRIAYSGFRKGVLLRLVLFMCQVYAITILLPIDTCTIAKHDQHHPSLGLNQFVNRPEEKQILILIIEYNVCSYLEHTSNSEKQLSVRSHVTQGSRANN